VTLLSAPSRAQAEIHKLECTPKRQGQVVADDATRDTSMSAVVAHVVGAMEAPLERPW